MNQDQASTDHLNSSSSSGINLFPNEEFLNVFKLFHWVTSVFEKHILEEELTSLNP